MTAGEASLSLHSNREEINPIEMQREMFKGKNEDDSFESHIIRTYERGKKLYQEEFYIVVLLKKERLLKNIVRKYFFHRKSCPTPEYDQIVYRCEPKNDRIEFLWVVPDKHHCEGLPWFEDSIDPDQQELIQFIKQFNAGELDKKCALLNKELIA